MAKTYALGPPGARSCGTCVHNPRHHLSIQGALRRRGPLFGATLTALIALGVGREVRAATDCYWKAVSTASYSASTANWSCGVIPAGSGYNVHFDTSGGNGGTNAGCTISSGSPITFGTMTMTSYTGTVTVSSALTVTGDLTIQAGTLTNTGAGSISVTGNVNVSDTVTNGGDPTLVGYWSFDDASHNTDFSGTGATLGWTGTSGSNFTSDVSGTITFTDTTSVNLTNPNNTYPPSQYGKTSSNLSSLSSLCPATLTLSAWYKATSTDKSASEIVSGANTYGLRITSSGLVVMKRIAISGTAQWIEYQVPFSGVLDGNWHQIVGVIVTGTGGGMTAYLDGVPAAGAYVIGGTTTKLDSTTTPTATYAAEQPIDWTDAGTTKNAPLAIGYNPSGATGYNFGANYTSGSTSKKCGSTNTSSTSICEIDDVRVYNRALTAAQVAALAGGNQPGGGAGILSLSGSLTVSGGVTVLSTGTLTLATGSTLSIGSGKTLVMDGTLNASGGTITGAGAYEFDVGSSSTATPTLNISGLAVQNTNKYGMQINSSGLGVATGAATAFSQFDNIAFSKGTDTVAGTLLDIHADVLYLSSTGCSFDAGTAKTTNVAVTAVGTSSSGDGPRVLFGGTTCAASWTDATGHCGTSAKSDNDSNNDGVASAVGGAVVQFVPSVEDDTAGTIVGFPTAAFSWTDFTYYSTYVAFHDASGGSDVIYVRDASGNPLYSWIDPTSGEIITGTPQWITPVVGGPHYLYVSVNGSSVNTGKIYRLKDSGTGTTSGTLTVDASWGTSGAYSCTCTITSNLSIDTTNIYWAATTGTTTQQLFGISQASAATISAAWPVTPPSNVTTSSPALVTQSAGPTTIYLGTAGDLVQLAVDGTFKTNSAPGTITGRVSSGTSYLAATFGTSRLYAGDSSGTMWAISPAGFPGSTALWSYAAGGAITGNYYDAATDTLQFGTSGGSVLVIAGAGSTPLTGYPPALGSDPITAAPLYYGGVLVVGTTLGKLYFLDRSTTAAGGSPVLLKEYNFGPTESVSSISVGFDSSSNPSHYVVSTSSIANDGRLYYLDLVADPSPTYP